MSNSEVNFKTKAILHKDKSLGRLDLSFLKHIELEEYKKSELLAYWIYDYATYHDEEKIFNIAMFLIILKNNRKGRRLYKKNGRRNVKISNKALDLIGNQIIKFFTK